LDSAIREAFARFKLAFSYVKFGKGLQNDYVEGLIILVNCFDKVMTRETTINGFVCCGQDCRPDENGCTVDFRVMMNQCYSKIPDEQRTLMLEQAPGFVDIVKTRGKLLFTEITANGILPGPTTINRDHLSHIRHWAEVVSADYVVECYREEMALKDPVEVERRRAVAVVKKADEKARTEQSKAEAKAIMKAEAIVAKNIEHQRKLALTPEQKAQENAAKADEKEKSRRGQGFKSSGGCQSSTRRTQSSWYIVNT
jgi:hypothetical protein